MLAQRTADGRLEGHESFHALHERDEGAVANRRTGRAIRGAGVRPSERQDRGRGRRALLSRAVRAHEGRRRPERVREEAPERRPFEDGPQRQRHHRRDETTEAPSPEASRDLRRRAGERRREHERERRGEHAGRPGAAERRHLHHGEADDQRHDRGEDGLVRDEGADGDQHAADRRRREVRRGAGPRRTAEVGHREQGEGREGREQRRGLVARHRVDGGQDPGERDRGAQPAAEREILRGVDPRRRRDRGGHGASLAARRGSRALYGSGATATIAATVL